MGSKRLCRICGKSLAEANKEDICFHHQAGMVIKARTPITGCTSYDPANPEALKPGDAGYNEQAFHEDVVGAIDEDGNLYEIDLGDVENRVAEVYGGDQIITEETLARQEQENKDFQNINL
jgi:hypothetical protein